MKIIMYLLVLSGILFSCSKEGPGGRAAIQGTVKRQGTPVPGATVYIKYGVKESPGSNILYYDANVTVDANAHYIFSDLKTGDYYLFSVGFDSTNVQIVSGGIPAKIKGKNETVTADILVTK